MKYWSVKQLRQKTWPRAMLVFHRMYRGSKKPIDCMRSQEVCGASVREGSTRSILGLVSRSSAVYRIKAIVLYRKIPSTQENEEGSPCFIYSTFQKIVEIRRIWV